VKKERIRREKIRDEERERREFMSQTKQEYKSCTIQQFMFTPHDLARLFLVKLAVIIVVNFYHQLKVTAF
jgi:hypothetical protein